MANSKAVVCDDPGEDCPIEALVNDMETIFRIFPKVCIVQTPDFESLVADMIDTYKAFVEARPNTRFLRHASDISNYAHMKLDKSITSNVAFFKRRLIQYLNDPYSEIAKELLVSSSNGILRWMTTPPPVNLAKQTPADVVNWDLSQTFFRGDFGGFDYVGAFDSKFLETKKGNDQRADFHKYVTNDYSLFHRTS
jgi:hypothetical protein